MADEPAIGIQAPPAAIADKGAGITLADLVTVTGYGLGLWWASGGPGWAALASMACDELDGPIARARDTAGASGSALDWGADVALTPMALVRLSRDLEKPAIAAVGAPLVLAVQAKMRGTGFKPPVGSARAVVMAVALVVEYGQRQKARSAKREARRAK